MVHCLMYYQIQRWNIPLLGMVYDDENHCWTREVDEAVSRRLRNAGRGDIHQLSAAGKTETHPQSAGGQIETHSQCDVQFITITMDIWSLLCLACIISSVILLLFLGDVDMIVVISLMHTTGLLLLLLSNTCFVHSTLGAFVSDTLHETLAKQD